MRETGDVAGRNDAVAPAARLLASRTATPAAPQATMPWLGASERGNSGDQNQTRACLNASLRDARCSTFNK